MNSSTDNDETKGQKRKPKLPSYHDLDGYILPLFLSLDVVKSAFKYKPLPGDLFIVAYPKCGTTWVQNIVGCIFRKGKPFQSAIEFMTQTPFLEMDCCVSFYHHTENIPGFKFEGGEFDDYFELFIEGKVNCGDYFDNLLSWYEHRNDPNVLFITYEQLKEDIVTYVLKIAQFIGPQYKKTLEKDPAMLKDVIHHSSFGFLKEHINDMFLQLREIPKQHIENNPDIPQGLRKLLTSDGDLMNPKIINRLRKGIVGDWRNYFSPNQKARLMKKYRERTAGTDIPDLWKDCI